MAINAKMYKDTYKDNPMLVFEAIGDRPDRYPFQFGKAKAQRLVGVIEAEGLDTVIRQIYELAGETMPARIEAQFQPH